MPEAGKKIEFAMDHATITSINSHVVPTYVESQENYWNEVFAGGSTRDDTKEKSEEIEKESFTFQISPELSLDIHQNAVDLTDTEMHKISINDLQRMLRIEDLALGLSSEEIQRRRPFGLNEITPKKESPIVLHFLRCQVGGFSPLLFVAAILCELAYIIQVTNGSGIEPYDNMYLGFVLLFVALFQGTALFVQETRAANVTKAIMSMLSLKASVLRDGKDKDIDAKYLVCGDIVKLSAGDRVPADVRILTSENCKVDNSALSGESEPQSLVVPMTSENPLESRNIAFNGTMVIEGSATGIVVSIGDETVLGKIARIVVHMKEKESPLSADLANTAKMIALTAIIFGVLLFILQLAIDIPQGSFKISEALVLTCGYLVAIVPAGLPIANSTMLSIVCQRMSRKQVIVKSMSSVETLGCCTVLCSDKTGTLTQNRMTVSHVFCAGQIHSVLETMDAALRRTLPFIWLAKISVLCNKAGYSNNTCRVLKGDATESALLSFGENTLSILSQENGDPSSFVSCEQFRQNNPKLAEIPFNSRNKYQVSLHQIKDESFPVVLFKGAPERVFSRCSFIMDSEGAIRTINSSDQDQFSAACFELAGQGERVLGFSVLFDQSGMDPTLYTSVPEPNFPMEKMCFVGLVSMIDPPREEVPRAVLNSKLAGIQVVMVTGDHPLTAFAIAKKVNIISSDAIDSHNYIAEGKKITSSLVGETPFGDHQGMHLVVNGEELQKFSHHDWDCVFQYPELVFARTSPSQKMTIVEEFQRRGHVVGVTGDGVNDSPALKKANIGIAMGIQGTDVAKEAADVILLNDNFASIIDGIEQGRAIFENMKKALAYMIGGNSVELLPPVFMMLFGLPQALSTFLMIAICCFTDMGPTLSLAWQPPDVHVMNDKPRNIKKNTLFRWPVMYYSWGFWGLLVATAGGYTAYFAVMDQSGFSPKDLWQSNIHYMDENINSTTYRQDFISRVDKNNFDYSYDHRLLALNTAQTAYFAAAVAFQIFHIFTRKRKTESQFHQIFSKITGKVPFNWKTWIGVAIELCALLLLIYVPFINQVFKTAPLQWNHFFYGVPAGLFVMLFEETRKYFMRKYPGGTLAQYTYP